MVLICKNRQCRKEFVRPKAKEYQVYCSRECAPYGNYGKEKDDPMDLEEIHEEGNEAHLDVDHS